MEFFGVSFLAPVAVDWPGTILAINVGGAAIPILLSFYLVMCDDVWEPARRLRLIYMPDATLPASGTGPIVEDVLFDVKPGRTVVRIMGNGVPGEREWDPHFLALRRGWAFWLHALKRHLEAGLAPEEKA